MKIYYIDLFCGAGGTTTGVEMSEAAEVAACVNHDAMAIRSHKANHPKVLHFTEDVRDMRVVNELAALVRSLRKEQPGCLIYVWASLECTNFSKAKGGMPRDADSRTLAECLYLYIEAFSPDGVWIENVEEFMSWGPLDENGKPVSRKAGSEYIQWVNKMQSFGYRFDYRMLNAADFGAYTSRKRFFAQFMKPELPMAWPVATHAKKVNGGMFGSLQPWKAVRDVLELDDHGQSIFGRKKALSEKTLERIWHGLVKYVAGGKEAHSHFISKYYSGKPEHKNISIDGPAGAIRTKDGQALVKVDWMLKYNSTNGDTGAHIPPSLDEPSPVVSTQGRLGIIMAYHGNGHNCHSADGPAPTIPTHDSCALVQPQWLDKYYSGAHNHQSIDQPAGTVMSTDKNNLVTVSQFVYDHQYGNSARSLDQPSQTLIASMKRKPPYFLTAVHGSLSIEVTELDTEWSIKIKEFMVMYGIVDIRMRMLKVSELKRIQGFPAFYILEGTQADQKKFIGNSVVPMMAAALVSANAESVRASAIQTKTA